MSAREPLFPKTSQLRDLDELRKQSRADTVAQDLPDVQLAQFEAVTQAMKAALSDEPALALSDELSEAQRWAIEQLYVAYTARDPITTNHVSALDRNGRFNRALAILQPVLAVALRPDFLQGRSVYAALTERVSSLRKAITRGIIAETMPRARRSDAKAADQDDDDGTGDDGDAGGGDAGGDGDAGGGDAGGDGRGSRAGRSGGIEPGPSHAGA